MFPVVKRSRNKVPIQRADCPLPTWPQVPAFSLESSYHHPYRSAAFDQELLHSGLFFYFKAGKPDQLLSLPFTQGPVSPTALIGLQPAVSLTPNTTPSIKLQSSDGEIFEVDVEIAKQSVPIKTMLEDLGMDGEGDDDPVPLTNVNAAILKKVIPWCTHHKDDPPPPEEEENKEKRTDDIPVWYQEFLKVDQGTLFELILAANYLDIKGLLDVTCKTVANMTKGKTPKEIHKTFNIKNDFTEEEEAQVRKENQWCEEK
ncbi:S-phase kinase-associated protein 1-like [Aotus nancymaae]|uniref:S-phase kinase-associated protein 1-like n=1 Tax=Aotus nancymaae TaxID=37293 RepID=UPI0030FF3319